MGNYETLLYEPPIEKRYELRKMTKDEFKQQFIRDLGLHKETEDTQQ